MTTQPLALGLGAVFLFAGCLQAIGEDSEDATNATTAVGAEGPMFGLGLAIPDEFPVPANWSEGDAEVAAFGEFILGDGQRVLEGCNAPNSSNEYVIERVAEGRYLGAISAILSGCATSSWMDYSKVADEAIRNNREVEVYLELREQAVKSWRAELDQLNSAEPGSLVDAQFFGFAASQSFFANESLKLASTMMAAYNDTQRSIDYETALLNVMAIRDESTASAELLALYDWKAPACQPPAFEVVRDRMRERLEEHTTLAWKVAEPGDDEHLHSPIGRLLRGQWPNFEYFVKYEWTAALLFSEPDDIWAYEFFLEPKNQRLPTPEEAAFLIAEYRSTTRTIQTEGTVLGMLEHLSEEGRPWDEDQARYAHRLDALVWQMEEMDCPGG